ncbi:MAG: DegT/DnrJ/EryC1/StrS family aminotransferase, partial [Sciscionella sp.]
PSDRSGISSDVRAPQTPSAMTSIIAPAPERLRYLRPELPPLEELARYYALSEERQWYSNQGPCYERFAASLADYVGNVQCVPVNNCTLGLMVALRVVCGEPAGRRRLIALPSFTFTATACAVKWAGFEPLFVDIERDSFQLDPNALDAALAAHEGRVAGVLGCATFGTAPPSATRQGWRDACARYNLPLVMDSAAGFGAVDEHGVLLGAQGDTEVFSFHATKPFAIGEGGAIITRQPSVAERVERVMNFGIDPTNSMSGLPGLNAKLSELHCAMGLATLDRYRTILAARRGTVAKMKQAVADHPVGYQAGSEGSTWQGFHVTLPTAALRNRAVSFARQELIEVRKCWDPPLHQHPAFAGAPDGGDLTVTEQVAARSITLPMANRLGPRQIDRIARLIELVFSTDHHRRPRRAPDAPRRAI